MRIGVLLDRISQGGYPIAAAEEVRFLSALGHETDLLIIQRENKREYSYGDFFKSLRVRYLSDKFPPFFRLFFKFPFFSFFSTFHVTSPFFCHRALKKGEFDAIIVHGTYSCFFAIAAKYKLKIPYLAFIWDPATYILPKVYSDKILKFLFPVFFPLAKFLDKKIIKTSSAVLSCSNVHKQLFKSLGTENVKIIYPGCFAEDSIPDHRGNYMLALTKWDICKKPDMLLDILLKMKNPIKLIVAGFWVKKVILDNFTKRVKEMGLEELVEIQGPADKNKAKMLYSGCRFLIHPHFEAFGMIALEAASFGAPFIIPSGSGVTELFQHQKECFIPKDKDIEAYAQHADMLASNERLAYEMGKKAWVVAKKYSWKYHAQQIDSILNNSLNK